jgi:dTDP-3-amino-2,3,6-trideoxy-4-keto-D-glucose/dTDP-3-amino-3,4,6-trideoxy-alpha-D-glucose/dTDP-2,6-dideoxy-D-kanosamine transaminase
MKTLERLVPLFSPRVVNADVDLRIPIERVLKSGRYLLGDELDAFEAAFARFCGTAHCVGVANGTDALELALRAVGVSRGDRVGLAANAGFYASAATHLIGADPHYVDIDPRTRTLSAEKTEEALETRPTALVVTHLYGQLADIEPMVRKAAGLGIPVVEDCAQAHGARRQGRRAGSFGTVGCFSFYPTKNLGALGDGGAIVTNDRALAARVAGLRQYGWGAKYRLELPLGRNSRLDEMQAAILREKLPRLDAWNAQRRDVARRYNEAFVDLPVSCPPSLGEDYVAHLYVVEVADRESFRNHLKDCDVATDVHYPVPDHLQEVYSQWRTRECLPATERACASVVSLPCYAGIETTQVERVIDVVSKYFNRTTRNPDPK